MTSPHTHSGLRILGFHLACILCLSMGSPDGWAASSAALETPNYRIYAEEPSPGATILRQVSKEREKVHDRILEFLERPGPSPKIDYHIYPSFESKGLRTGNTQLAHADHENNTIHLVINDWIRGDDPKMDAVLLLRRHLGQPATHLLEAGLTVYFSDKWRGRGYRYWAGRLYLSDNLPALADLVDNDVLRRESYLVVEAASASFIDFVVNKFGGTVLIEHYRSWQPGPEEIQRLEGSWHAYLEAQTVELAPRIRVEREQRRRPLREFQKGFCHAHEGYQIFNGYLSRKSDEALEKLAGMGTNAVSITPFTYMRDPDRPVPLRFSHGAGSESDESVIHSSHTAKRLGMSVMLKPHVWLGRGSWPGEVYMQNDADWQAFFDYYYRWMRHYAMLAEMYQLDLLCIGVELSRTTSREDDWRRLIKRLRGLYSGGLVYAANWGEEFENVGFWDDLDFIGIDCYYPLAGNDEATEEDLRKGADKMVARVERVHKRFRKPVLFTEIGFTSTRAPWKKPHQPGWRSAPFSEHQAMCYQAVFGALYGKPWCRGLYWWKWPSFLEHGGRNNPGYTPNNKPAEAIVREWYGKSW